MKTLCSLAVMSVALLAAPAAQATLVRYAADLSGPAEAPPNASPGVGHADVSFDTLTNLLSVHATFSGLLGTTTASHIHCCTAVAGTGTSIVATETPTFGGFPLGVTSGTFDNSYDMTLAASYNPAFITANGGTTASAEQAFLLGLNAGKAYFNIHSTSFPAGEIRGFLLQVSEPPAAMLAALALAALGISSRKRLA